MAHPAEASGQESNDSVPSSALLWLYHMPLERARRDLSSPVLISARIDSWHLFWFEIGPILTIQLSYPLPRLMEEPRPEILTIMDVR